MNDINFEKHYKELENINQVLSLMEKYKEITVKQNEASVEIKDIETMKKHKNKKFYGKIELGNGEKERHKFEKKGKRDGNLIKKNY